MSFGPFARVATFAVVMVLGVTLALAQEVMPLGGLSFAKKMKLAKAGDDTAQLAVAMHYEQGIEAKKDAQHAGIARPR